MKQKVVPILKKFYEQKCKQSCNIFTLFWCPVYVLILEAEIAKTKKWDTMSSVGFALGALPDVCWISVTSPKFGNRTRMSQIQCCTWWPSWNYKVQLSQHVDQDHVVGTVRIGLCWNHSEMTKGPEVGKQYWGCVWYLNAKDKGSHQTNLTEGDQPKEEFNNGIVHDEIHAERINLHEAQGSMNIWSHLTVMLMTQLQLKLVQFLQKIMILSLHHMQMCKLSMILESVLEREWKICPVDSTMIILHSNPLLRQTMT